MGFPCHTMGHDGAQQVFGPYDVCTCVSAGQRGGRGDRFSGGALAVGPGLGEPPPPTIFCLLISSALVPCTYLPILQTITCDCPLLLGKKLSLAFRAEHEEGGIEGVPQYVDFPRLPRAYVCACRCCRYAG